MLLIGSGAREHAIANALVRSGVRLHVHMDRLNPGLVATTQSFSVGSTTDHRSFPELHRFDYAVIGPEAPLDAGICDFIELQGVPCVAPTKKTAMVETSKSWARDVIRRSTPQANPDYRVVRNLDDLHRFLKDVPLEKIVVKPNGLTGGKGVRIFGEHLRSQGAVEKYIHGLLITTGVVVVEERLMGTEFTIQAFVDGRRLVPMPLVRDYKRAYDGDQGPNTGSMGSHSQENHGLLYVTEGDFKTATKIMESNVKRIRKDVGVDYKGVLYGQFMKTNEGIKVVEYNARFGDPEAMNVLATLETSMDDVCRRIIEGNLTTVRFENKATVCVYVVPEGYPGPDVMKNSPITIGDDVTCEIFYASVYEQNGTIFTTGSRSIGVLAKGDTVKDARNLAYESVRSIRGRIRYRTDIAAEA